MSFYICVRFISNDPNYKYIVVTERKQKYETIYCPAASVNDLPDVRLYKE